MEKRERTPEQRARDDLMILHLKQAVEHGFSLATPGSSDAVREAFPEFFATEAEKATIDTDDELELDDHPMVSHGDDGYWVNAWVWTACSQECAECGIDAGPFETLDGKLLCEECYAEKTTAVGDATLIL